MMRLSRKNMGSSGIHSASAVMKTLASTAEKLCAGGKGEEDERSSEAPPGLAGACLVAEE